MQLHVPTVVSVRTKQRRGFTLAEVVIAIAIVMVVFSSIIVAYTQACYRAEWSGHSLAAESLATKQIEQARSARWDPVGGNANNFIYSLNLLGKTFSGGVLKGYTWATLDLPSSGGNFAYATNYVTVNPGPTSTGANTTMIRVDTVWSFRWRTQTKMYTNTIATYIAPDNKLPEDLL